MKQAGGQSEHRGLHRHGGKAHHIEARGVDANEVRVDRLVFADSTTMTTAATGSGSGSGFEPTGGDGSAGNVLTKTANAYEWQALPLPWSGVTSTDVLFPATNSSLLSAATAQSAFGTWTLSDLLKELVISTTGKWFAPQQTLTFEWFEYTDVAVQWSPTSPTAIVGGTVSMEIEYIYTSAHAVVKDANGNELPWTQATADTYGGTNTNWVNQLKWRHVVIGRRDPFNAGVPTNTTVTSSPPSSVSNMAAITPASAIDCNTSTGNGIVTDRMFSCDVTTSDVPGTDTVVTSFTPGSTTLVLWAYKADAYDGVTWTDHNLYNNMGGAHTYYEIDGTTLAMPFSSSWSADVAAAYLPPTLTVTNWVPWYKQVSTNGAWTQQSDKVTGRIEDQTAWVIDVIIPAAERATTQLFFPHQGYTSAQSNTTEPPPIVASSSGRTVNGSTGQISVCVNVFGQYEILNLPSTAMVTGYPYASGYPMRSPGSYWDGSQPLQTAQLVSQMNTLASGSTDLSGNSNVTGIKIGPFDASSEDLELKVGYGTYSV